MIFGRRCVCTPTQLSSSLSGCGGHAHHSLARARPCTLHQVCGGSAAPGTVIATRARARFPRDSWQPRGVGPAQHARALAVSCSQRASARPRGRCMRTPPLNPHARARAPTARCRRAMRKNPPAGRQGRQGRLHRPPTPSRAAGRRRVRPQGKQRAGSARSCWALPEHRVYKVCTRKAPAMERYLRRVTLKG